MEQSIFRKKVLDVVSRIPSGTVLTYKEVARLSGSPRACRAVGTIVSKNFDPKIPCHRVVRSDGTIGNYNRGSNEKNRKLRQEGVVIHGQKKI